MKLGVRICAVAAATALGCGPYAAQAGVSAGAPTLNYKIGSSSGETTTSGLGNNGFGIPGGGGNGFYYAGVSKPFPEYTGGVPYVDVVMLISSARDSYSSATLTYDYRVGILADPGFATHTDHLVDIHGMSSLEGAVEHILVAQATAGERGSGATPSTAVFSALSGFNLVGGGDFLGYQMSEFGNLAVFGGSISLTAGLNVLATQFAGYNFARNGPIELETLIDPTIVVAPQFFADYHVDGAVLDLGPGVFNAAPPPPSPTPTTSAAPEPTGWALMIAGFGLAGVGLRRRRAATA